MVQFQLGGLSMSSESGKPPDLTNTERARPNLDWNDTEIMFSDWVMVQAAPDGSVILSFFQAGHPYYYTEEERAEARETLHCLTRLAVSPGQFDRIIELYTGFQQQLKEFFKTQEKSDSQKGRSTMSAQPIRSI